jgi:hypothetical protein
MYIRKKNYFLRIHSKDTAAFFLFCKIVHTTKIVWIGRTIVKQLFSKNFIKISMQDIFYIALLSFALLFFYNPNIFAIYKYVYIK